MDKERKILILSGTDAMLLRVRKRLEKKEHYRVSWTSSYDEALSLVRDGRVDFLFYEVSKALADGAKKLDAMKDANSRVPVVVSAVLEMPPRPCREEGEGEGHGRGPGSPWGRPLQSG
jgi:DNA-binding NtrC family response regulator